MVLTWKNGRHWVGIKTTWARLRNNQEAYDAECAALARALETAARRQTTPERVTIFTNAQAALRRMASEEPGPGQMRAVQARKHIATLRRARPNISIVIRWCPAHKGVAGNEKPMSAPSSQQRSRTYTVWSGCKPEHGRYRPPIPSHTSSKRSLRRSRPKPAAN
jgi:ribonuclease HI